VRTQWADSF